MEYYPDYDDDRDALPARNSPLGVASFIIAQGAGGLEFLIIALIAVLETTTAGGLDEDSPAAGLLGLGMIIGLLLALVGLGLGIGGLCQGRRTKVLAIVGVVINSILVVGVLLLVMVGLAMG